MIISDPTWPELRHIIWVAVKWSSGLLLGGITLKGIAMVIEPYRDKLHRDQHDRDTEKLDRLHREQHLRDIAHFATVVHDALDFFPERVDARIIAAVKRNPTVFNEIIEKDIMPEAFEAAKIRDTRLHGHDEAIQGLKRSFTDMEQTLESHGEQLKGIPDMSAALRRLNETMERQEKSQELRDKRDEEREKLMQKTSVEISERLGNLNGTVNGLTRRLDDFIERRDQSEENYQRRRQWENDHPGGRSGS